MHMVGSFLMCQVRPLEFEKFDNDLNVYVSFNTVKSLSIMSKES